MFKVGLFGDKIHGDAPIGMGNIALQIARRIQKSEKVDLYLVHHAFSKHPIYSECKNIVLPSFRPRRLAQYLDPFLLKRYKLDILHYPDHNMLPLIVKPARRVILTIHGMSALFVTKEFVHKPFNKRAERVMRRQSSKIDRIITVSSFLKEGVVEKFGIAPEKITVIPNGIDLSLFRQCEVDQDAFASSIGLRPPYIFHVSNLKAIKNTLGILESFKIVSEANKNVALAIAGGIKSTLLEMQRRTGELGLTERVKFLGTIKGEKLVQLFNNAELLVFPSHFEGFGLPVLEAMACGCPVVASDIPSFREFAGDAVVRVNPLSIEEISSACLSILDNEEQRGELIAQGLRRAREYSWDKTTKSIVSLYTELMKI